MERQYELDVPENYRIHLERENFGELVQALRKGGLPARYYTAYPVTVEEGETALSQQLIIYGDGGLEIYVLPFSKADGSKSIRGRIIAQEAVDTQKIEDIVREFSIKSTLRFTVAYPVKPGTPPSGF